MLYITIKNCRIQAITPNPADGGGMVFAQFHRPVGE